ncbi:glycosyltransferase family protein [Acanthopleuribacter pedis]|uniref:Teichoic acid biosynthesis protein n=1 Tax=Acanthopleuribacter pedis TaxID=442870 RepID=A0A8J7U6R6_9BACT|nr:glycosyltransferase family protein [Acanthopleuribacter pedis]MBO1320661.1 hypothetical protein [Acanthopleuribacter pedis]
MARIVYGVSGEGSGHAVRSDFVLEHLKRKGHEIKVVTYDRGLRILQKQYDCFETAGLHISSRHNQVEKVQTFFENLAKLPEAKKRLKALKSEVFDSFQPDCVMTDFEPMSAYLANARDLPLITIDNQQGLRYMKFPCPDYLHKDRRLAENLVRMLIPRPDVSLITTFYFGKPVNDRTFLFPPILRQSIRELVPKIDNFILVYLTRGYDAFLEGLKHFKRERFVVYGCDTVGEFGPITYKPFDRNTFAQDLANCKAVMATAGFSLITESLFLHKPYLALPIIGQFEQEINAYLLQRLSYGSLMRNLSQASIGNFLYHLPDFRDHLESYKEVQRQPVTQKLDELLADDCQLLRTLHEKRKEADREALPIPDLFAG